MIEYDVIYNQDCLVGMRDIPDNSINLVVTSPPYFGLRDYGIAEQIGLDDTPDEYVQRLVGVFREVYRVLKPNGTLWVNIGDTYATGTKAERKQSPNAGVGANNPQAQNSVPRIGTPKGYKTKDLIGIPWLLAFALQADGWFLRQDIIWHKPNPMPESVTDRCTKSHEYIFLLSKSPRYYFDNEAIKEDAKTYPYKKRNKRDVWSVSTKPLREAHFASFPIELITPCILAGSKEGAIVLDPFLGSGTTAIAAATLGRHYIGYEINSAYFDIACERLDLLEEGG